MKGGCLVDNKNDKLMLLEVLVDYHFFVSEATVYLQCLFLTCNDLGIAVFLFL